MVGCVAFGVRKQEVNVDVQLVSGFSRYPTWNPSLWDATLSFKVHLPPQLTLLAACPEVPPACVSTLESLPL